MTVNLLFIVQNLFMRPIIAKTFRNSKPWLSSRRHKHSLHIWCIWTSRKETCCILFPIDPRYERVWWAWIDRFTQCTSHFRTSSCEELMISSRTVLCYNAFCQCKRAFPPILHCILPIHKFVHKEIRYIYIYLLYSVHKNQLSAKRCNRHMQQWRR